MWSESLDLKKKRSNYSFFVFSLSWPRFISATPTKINEAPKHHITDKTSLNNKNAITAVRKKFVAEFTTTAWTELE